MLLVAAYFTYVILIGNWFMARVKGNDRGWSFPL